MFTNKALLIVDVQNDFCPNGSYPVPNGDEIIKPLNQILKYARCNDWKLYASRDWHPVSLFKDKPEKAHCIKNTHGAEYHPELNIKEDVEIISKGKDLSEAHYSAFNGNDISLKDLMKRNKIHEVYIGGLALEYCVRSTALDSIRYGFKTFIFRDATKYIKKDKGNSAIKELIEKGIIFIKTTDLNY